MKNSIFASSEKNHPWCHGCGHTPVIRSLQASLERHFKPQDVVITTDIGCIGMADSLFTCHTAHGLHGRSPALGSGIAMNLDEGKKTVVLLGDGGAAIGLQHVLECARMNVDLTLVICDNQNYAMTGGQCSAYTYPGVKTSTYPQGSPLAAYPLMEMLGAMGVMRAQTLATSKELASYFDRCLTHRGFTVVRTYNYCPSYTGKLNPGELTPKALGEFMERQGLAQGIWPATANGPVYRFRPKPRMLKPKVVEAAFDSEYSGTLEVLLAGSAGEGVQRAIETFARAAISSGLDVALRSEYPVTVGTGFSCSYISVSDKSLLCTTKSEASVALIISEDGLDYCMSRDVRSKRFVADGKLSEAPPEWERAEFSSLAKRQKAFASLVWLAREYGLVSQEALEAAAASVPSPKVQDSYRKVLGK